MASVELAETRLGEGPSLVVLHGLFGSARNWQSIARRLAERHAVSVLDMRNHGASPWTDTMTYPEMAEDVLSHIVANGLSRPCLIGHSMGGKAAMAAALLAPGRVGRLIVVDIAPVRYEHGFAALVDALQAVELDQVTKRAEADEMLAERVDDAAIRGFLLQNLVLREGHYTWRLNLAAIASSQSALWDFPQLPAPAVFDGPTLFIGGARSDYIRPDHRPVIERHFPRAEIEAIPDSGHWAHADQPEAFLRAVDGFLKRTG